MPTCKNCNTEFPNRMIIDGKQRYLHVRSYCLTCSPFGKNKGYDIRKQNTDKKYSNKECKSCLICSTEFFHPRKSRNNRNNSNSVCSNCRNWYRRYINKCKIYEILGNQCIECHCKDFFTLQIHHTNPNVKQFDFSARWNCSIEELIQEAKSCVLLCANCHSKKHVTWRQDIIDYYNKCSVRDSNP